ncbi:hypothetical protein Tco_1340574, partial [Tanacetum coccineum]
PQQYDLLLMRALNPTAHMMRLGGGYDWRAVIGLWDAPP